MWFSHEVDKLFCLSADLASATIRSKIQLHYGLFMSRYNFQAGRKYIAKLVRVSPRPIENGEMVSLSLVRLEFAIYWPNFETKVMESHGEYACRDLIVGGLIPTEQDLGLVNYAVALDVPAPINASLNWSSLSSTEKIIELQFGPPEIEGGRNPFASIAAFDSTGWEIQEYRYDKTTQWTTIRVAADAVGASESTVRRRLDDLESEWGARLVVRTKGTHRRIHLPLFLNLWGEN